jgi:hypothetical protein
VIFGADRGIVTSKATQASAFRAVVVVTAIGITIGSSGGVITVRPTIGAT